MTARLRRAAATALGRLLVATAMVAASLPSSAHRNGGSEASALSMLPIAVSVAAPVMILSAGVVLTAVAVDASARGTVYVLERASDGARMSFTVGSDAAAALSLGVGTAVAVSVIGSGWVLSAAGRAIAFIPNEIGKALLYNEQVTR
ncbi:MAG: hypothetical protein ABI564_04030 [Ideonella sp.]